jgi:chromosome partitioning protein
MRAITLACQKGGTGKSTLCVGLAVAAMEDGERVFILETDRQGTISNWAARRSNPEPVVERIGDRFQLDRALRALERKGCTLAIIDTPGSDNDFVADAIRAAKLCLVPARPSQADIEATIPTLKVIRRLDKEFAFVLTQTPARGERPTRVALALSEAGVLALPYIVLRNDHMDSLATGLAVSEFAPDSAAAAEIRALWAWSKQKIAVHQCAQCGATLLGPEWSEHSPDHRIRNVWSCKACRYQFETESRLACTGKVGAWPSLGSADQSDTAGSAA